MWFSEILDLKIEDDHKVITNNVSSLAKFKKIFVCVLSPVCMRFHLIELLRKLPVSSILTNEL